MSLLSYHGSIEIETREQCSVQTRAMLRERVSRLPVLRKQASRGARKGVGMKCRDAACRVYAGGKQHPVMLYFKCRDAACRVTGATYTIQLRGTPRPYIVEVGKKKEFGVI